MKMQFLFFLVSNVFIDNKSSNDKIFQAHTFNFKSRFVKFRSEVVPAI